MNFFPWLVVIRDYDDDDDEDDGGEDDDDGDDGSSSDGHAASYEHVGYQVECR